MPRATATLTLAFCLIASWTMAQTLTLERAVATAVVAHPDVAAAVAAESEARERQVAARAGWFPRVDVQEGWQRGNQPVFVFSSLLAQRRFTEADFALQALNHPGPVDNHRLAFIVRQPLFDGGATRAATTAAATAASLAAEAHRERAASIAADVTQAYAEALTADARLRAAAGAIDSATEDLARARARRDVGHATDADALALEVHLAEVRARHITAAADGRIARATLNRLMNVDLDRRWELVDAAPAAQASVDLAALEATALQARPDLAMAALRVEAADAATRAAGVAIRPRLSFEGGYEWNGDSWTSRASSWTTGIRADWSWSFGNQEAASLRAASRAADRARAERASAESAVRLDVRTALARVEAARARHDVGQTAVVLARESTRIVRDRYEAGLTGVTELLRTAAALLDAEALDAAARADLAVAAARLDRALGHLPATAPPE